MQANTLTVNGTFNTDNMTLDENLTVTGTTRCSGLSTMDNTSITSLNVTGNSNLTGTLDVTGNSNNFYIKFHWFS